MTGASSSPETFDRLLDLAVAIQQIPAPTFREKKRALLVRQQFVAEQFTDIAMDQLQNVYARLPGRSRARPLIVTAHLDTVFPDGFNGITRASERISGPGIGDNSIGLAALFGLVWMLRDSGIVLDSDIWLVANSREEGLGDLRGMQAVVERFGDDVRGYLVLEGIALPHVYHRAVGVQRYRVKVHTAGGHSWSDYGQPSAVHEIASLVSRLVSLPLPGNPRTTMNVGTISGGTGINVVASQATFELDVRSESRTALATVISSVEACIESVSREGVQIEVEVIGQRPSGGIPANHPWVELAGTCLAEQGFSARLSSGSTDANIPLSRGIPAIVLGITTGGGAHTTHEYIDIPPVGKGMRQLLSFVRRVMQSP